MRCKRHPTTAAQPQGKFTFSADSQMRWAVIEQAQHLNHILPICKTLKAQCRLTDRRQHGRWIAVLCDPMAQFKPLQSRSGQNNPVKLSPVELGKAGIEVAA
jgi:hypothetical protein